MPPESSNTSRIEQILTDIALAIHGAKSMIINVFRQNNTVNSAPLPSRIETGWGYMPVTTSSAAYAEVVTFATPFTSPPIVVATFGGDNLAAGGAAYGNGGSTIEAVVNIKTYSIDATKFTVHIAKPAFTNYGANGFVYYQWMAIGQ